MELMILRQVDKWCTNAERPEFWEQCKKSEHEMHKVRTSGLVMEYIMEKNASYATYTKELERLKRGIATMDRVIFSARMKLPEIKNAKKKEVVDEMMKRFKPPSQ
jgi:hypothetical protein